MLLVKQWSKAFSSLVGGIVVGMVGVLFSISFATLIFHGPLAPFLPAGIGIALVSGILFRSLVQWLGSTRLVIADIDALSVALLAMSAGTIVRQLDAAPDPNTLFFTVIVTLAIITLLTGGFLFLLGYFQIGELIRYIPWPVFGGFVAATGCLMVQTAFSIMVGQSLTLATVLQLFQLEQLIHWLPGLALGMVLLWLSLANLPEWVMPVSIVGLIGLFHLGRGVAQISLETATTQGWLLGDFPAGGLWQPWHLQGLSQVQWSYVYGQMLPLGTIMVITALGILFNATALEVVFQQDLDINRELKAAGIANVVVGIGGGWVGYHTLDDSSLAYRMGGGNPLTNWVSIAFFALILILGAQPLSLFPKFILGGLLLFAGLSNLKQGLYDSWFTLPKIDYGVIVLMVGVMTVLGFLPGIGVGLGLAIALFIYQYSQTPVIKHTLTAAQRPSKVARTRQQQTFLRTASESIYLIDLQGFLFFGSTYSLVEQVKQRLANPDHPQLRFIIFNFRAVEGLDTSAVLSFAKLAQLVQQQDITLVFTHLSPEVQNQFQIQSKQDLSPQHCPQFAALDQGISWCESQLLAEVPWRRQRILPLALQLDQQFSSSDAATTFMDALVPLELEEGDWIFHPGEMANALYFIESGQVSTWIPLANGQLNRIRAWGAGHWVGELDFYRQQPYHIAASIEASSMLYKLNQASWQMLLLHHPEAANAFQSLMLKRLSHDLADAYQEIRHLL